MSLQPASLYALALIGATILTAGLASWSMYQRARGSHAFTLLMLALGWWTCGYAQEINSPDLATAVLWGKLQYISIVAVPPLWFIFGLRYSGRDPAPHPWNRLALAVLPLVTLALVWTTEIHGLVWEQMAQVDAGGLHVLDVTYGPWFWVHTFYSYNLIIAGSVLLLSAAWRAAPSYRRESVYLVIGALLPLAGNVIYLLDLTPIAGLDLTPLLFTGSALLFAWASYKSYLAMIGPVARHKMVEEMVDVVLVLDEHGHIADINPAGQRLLGVAHVFGLRLATVAPDLAAHLLAAEAPAELSVGEGEKAHIYDVQRTPLHGWQGDRGGELIVLREITLRKHAERRLRAQKELFAALAALAHAVATRPTLPETLQSILKVASELTGALRGSLFLFAEGSTTVQSIYVHGIDSAVTERQVMEQVLDTGLAGWVVRNQRVALANDTASDPRWTKIPDQPYVIGSALAVPVMEGGHVLGVITLSHREPQFFQAEHAELMSAAAAQIGLAVRNAQMYENQRQLAERAEAASRAKSTFLATVSHELRTPLNVIIGYSELLTEDLVNRDDGATVEHLHQVTAAGRRLLGMVNDILELSRVEAGQAALDQGPVDLEGLVTYVASRVRPLAAQNRNKVDLDYPDDLGMIVSDGDKLRQILLHLLTNACKFTEDGHIRLAIRREPSGAIIFTIADTGIGISEEQLPQLFADFTQGDGSSTRRYGGVGMGLALSQHLCRLLGGTISVTSQVGQGSTFALRLPATRGEQAPSLSSTSR